MAVGATNTTKAATIKNSALETRLHCKTHSLFFSGSAGTFLDERIWKGDI